MAHAHGCRMPLPCATHKVPNTFVLRSVISRLQLQFSEEGLPCLPSHALPSLWILRLVVVAGGFAGAARVAVDRMVSPW